MSLERPKPRDYLVLGAITFVAALVRFVGLTRDSLWTDETFSGFASQLPSLGEVIRFIANDVHPPGYFVSLWLWAQIFGSSEYSVRAFSALGGVLLVLAVFRLGRQLFDVPTGLLASLFAALLIQGIYYSQEVRAYIWLALFSALSCSVLLDYLRTRSNRWLAAFVLVSSINSYFHYFGLLFTFLLVGGWFLTDIRQKRLIWPSVTSGLSVALLFCPWIPLASQSASKPVWIPMPSVRFVSETANILYGPGYVVVMVALAMIAAGVFVGVRSNKLNLKSPEVAVVAWILVPLVASVLVSLVLRPVYTPRNMMLAFGAGSLLLARSITLVTARAIAQWVLAVGLLASMYGAHFVFGQGYLVRPVKQQVREVATYVATHNLEKLPIYTFGRDGENFHYYLAGTNQAPLIKNIGEDLSKKPLLSVLTADSRFWIASAGTDWRTAVDFERDFVVEDSAEFILARAYLLRRK